MCQIANKVFELMNVRDLDVSNGQATSARVIITKLLTSRNYDDDYIAKAVQRAKGSVAHYKRIFKNFTTDKIFVDNYTSVKTAIESMYPRVCVHAFNPTGKNNGYAPIWKCRHCPETRVSN